MSKEIMSGAAHQEKILGAGVTLPDVTDRLDDVLTVAFMTPTGNPNKLFIKDSHGELISERGPGGITQYAIRPDVECYMGVPILLWGLSGVAKSGTIKSVSKKLRLPLEQVWPGTKAPESFDNVPVVLDNKLASACMLTELLALNELQGGILNIEEASQAAPAVQSALMPLFLDRRVGQTRAHQLVRIVGTANPPAYAANGFALAAPFSNRMLHVFVSKPSTDALNNFIMNEGLEQSVGMEREHKALLDNWHESWTNTKGLWSGFIHSVVGEQIRHQQPEPNSPQEGFAWPSDRSWETAFRLLATSRALGMKSTLEPVLIESSVGHAAAKQFLTWLAAADLPNTEDALRKGWKINRERLDQVMAVYNAMTMYVLNFPAEKREEQIDAAGLLWQRLGELAKTGLTDIVATYAVQVINKNLGATGSGCERIKKYTEVPLKAIAGSGVYIHAQEAVKGKK